MAPILAVLLVFTAGAWADEPAPAPTDPPQARLQPPSGVAAQARLQPPSGVTAQARLNPPSGAPTPTDTTTQARVQPPVGEPITLTELLLRWLQSRLSVPNG